jgi:hypothetical protein
MDKNFLMIYNLKKVKFQFIKAKKELLESGLIFLITLRDKK